MHLRVTKNSRKKKEQFWCGMRFSEGHSRIFLLEGGWWLSRMNIPNQTWPLPKSRVQRWGYAKQHPQSILQHFSNSIMNKQATSKIWSLYSFEGFLLYIRDIVKITKVTNINSSIIEQPGKEFNQNACENCWKWNHGWPWWILKWAESGYLAVKTCATTL